MADEKWRQIKEIFNAALRQKPEDRQKFLDRACGGDTALRKEVESLLSSYSDAESFMESPAAGEVADEIAGGDKILETGKSFGHYEIIEQIGIGGMGKVYLAQDTRLDRQVAIKILNEKFSRHKSNLNRFIQEAKVASALNHPNILVIHEVGESDNFHYIVSEFISGKTLREIFKEKILKLTEVIDVAVQIANALVAAHEAHLVHRDIKPENIMIRPDGFVKVLDFGLAKLVEQKAVGFKISTIKQTETAKGVILGTVNYMSPEQAKGERVDERTDIFSLGILIYEMLAGRTPFARDSVSETFANLINQEPPPISRFAAGVPDELQRIVFKSLRKKKDERYQTMKDLFSDLKSLQKRLEFEIEFEIKDFSETSAETEKLVTKTREFLPPTETGKNAEKTNEIKSSKKTSTVENFDRNSSVSESLKTRKYFYAVGLLILIAAAGFGYYFWSAKNTDSIEKKTLAVLPFINSGGDPNAEYLSDGITESIINNLSQISHLKVMSKNSAFRFKNQQSDTRAIASQLGVEILVTGDIKQIEDKFVINIRLINAAEDSQIWGNQYVKTTDNIFAVQNEIAQAVAGNLRVILTDAERKQINKKPTENFEAYQLYLQGRANTISPNTSKAINYFQQAIDIDPNYAPAYSGLASAYRTLVLADDAPPGEMMPKAKAAAMRAIALDDQSSETHAALGTVAFFYEWNWNEAEKHFLQALELNPNSADARFYYAHLLSNLGRHEEALTELKHAIELDPLYLGFSTLEGQFLFYAGKYDEAAERLKKVSSLEPNFWLPHLFISRVYIEKGMFREAVEEATKARDLSGGNTEAISFIGYALAKSGEKEKARQVLEQLKKLSAEKYVPPFNIALVYNALGETDEVFESLEKGFQVKDVRMVFLKIDPKWNNLRTEPRFIELMRRMNF